MMNWTMTAFQRLAKAKHVRSIVKRIRPRRDHIVIACFPKSGSTYMSKAICEILDLKPRWICEFYHHDEQDISARKLRRCTERSVIQQHIKGTYDNVRLMQQYRIRPIVNVRNVFDVILSLHDHWEREGHEVCTGYVHRRFWTMNFDERMNYIIHVHLPWYFNFFVSWREAAERIEILPMSYERFFADRVGSLQQMLQFNHVHVATDRIEAALERLKTTDTRLNKGRSGRGAELLSEGHKEAIRRLARSWCIDLDEMASIGLRSQSRPDRSESAMSPELES